jgi:hypothetical protein
MKKMELNETNWEQNSFENDRMQHNKSVLQNAFCLERD